MFAYFLKTLPILVNIVCIITPSNLITMIIVFFLCVCGGGYLSFFFFAMNPHTEQSDSYYYMEMIELILYESHNLIYNLLEIK